MPYTQLKVYLHQLSQTLTAPAQGDFKHPCIVVNQGKVYTMQLWDWGNWANNIALRQHATEEGDTAYLYECEKGSVLNFLDQQKEDGSIEIAIFSDPASNYFTRYPHRNVHKPVLAQHVAFILKYSPDLEWIRPHYPKLKAFNRYYEENAKHESGLLRFATDPLFYSAVYTILPSTMVIKASPPMQVRGSSFQITISASLPGSKLPTRSAMSKTSAG